MKQSYSIFALIFFLAVSTGFKTPESPGLGPDVYEQNRAASSSRFFWADFDLDGRQDIFILAEDDEGGLYRNQGDGNFEQVNHWANPVISEYGNSALWGDVNLDGYPDLYLVRSGENRLYINMDGGEFVEAATEAGIDQAGAGLSARWLDYNEDGLSDLEVDNLDGTILYQNLGDGSFLEVFDVQIAGWTDYAENDDGVLTEYEIAEDPIIDGFDSFNHPDADLTGSMVDPGMEGFCSSKDIEIKVLEVLAGTGLLGDEQTAAPAGSPESNGIQLPIYVTADFSDPDGLVWMKNTGDGFGIRGESAAGTGIEAISSEGLALKAQGTSYLDGFVGIGTETPLYELDVAGDINIESDGALRAGRNWLIGQTGTDDLIHLGSRHVANDFRFDSNAGYGLVTIKSTGDVGIGTQNPAEKLDVTGSVKMNGFKMSTGAGNGYVLTSDSDGNGTWQVSGGGGFALPYEGSASSDSPVFKITNDGDGAGVHGENGNGSWGSLGASSTGVRGSSDNYGVYGTGNYTGVYGYSAAGSYGVYGKAGSLLNGNYGCLGGEEFGVKGWTGDPGDYSGHFVHSGGGTAIKAEGDLLVDGSIRTRELVVTLDGWADFVFEDDYDLMPLTQVAAHIEQDGHLPGIPPASEVLSKGVCVGEMQARMLQKIEELTLYVIELKKQNDDLAERLGSSGM